MNVKLYPVIVIPVMLFFFTAAIGQDIDLKDLKTPNAPGFQILDISPSSIERPTNPKAFAFSMFNLTSNGTAIPKNFAFELSPYWYTKPENATVYRYLNIRDDKSSNVFSGIFNKLSVSLVSSYSDSTAGSLLKNTNYVSFGARTNLITYRTNEQHQKMKDAVKSISQRIRDLKSNKEQKRKLKALFTKYHTELQSETDPEKRKIIISKISSIEIEIDKMDESEPEDLEKKIDKDELAQEGLKMLDAIPLFQLDAAYAYSAAFPGNAYGNKRYNRSGFWINGTLSGFSLNQNKLNDNLSISACLRFMNDNVLTDTLMTVFAKKNFIDVGGKLEYSINKFSLSIEYLKRNYSNNSTLNSDRTVGMFQYKVNDNLYVSGTYGKNFGNFNNLFTLLGINWGFGKSSFKL